MKLKENERIDDLEFKGLKIIQNKNGFCFGIDSVILSDFAKNVKPNSNIMDLGTGTGILPILLSAKTEAKKIWGIEIQEYVANMAKRSVLLNKLEEKIEIINENILNLESKFEKNSIDVIVTNPPYKKKGTGVINEKESKLIARHEITASLEDFIEISSKLLKYKGEIFMVHRPERLVDILYLMRNKKIEPKNIRFVYANKESEPKLILVRGVKNAKEFLKVEKNLYIYNEDGNYSDEILKIYNKI